LLQQARRHVEAQRLRSLEVVGQLELDERLHRQFARLLALQDAIGISSRAGNCRPGHFRKPASGQVVTAPLMSVITLRRIHESPAETSYNRLITNLPPTMKR
jgi:hypothetical protein